LGNDPEAENVIAPSGKLIEVVPEVVTGIVSTKAPLIA
jgi:hypothetical protein